MEPLLYSRDVFIPRSSVKKYLPTGGSGDRRIRDVQPRLMPLLELEGNPDAFSLEPRQGQRRPSLER